MSLLRPMPRDSHTKVWLIQVELLKRVIVPLQQHQLLVRL